MILSKIKCDLEVEYLNGETLIRVIFPNDTPETIRLSPSLIRVKECGTNRYINSTGEVGDVEIIRPDETITREFVLDTNDISGDIKVRYFRQESFDGKIIIIMSDCLEISI